MTLEYQKKVMKVESSIYISNIFQSKPVNTRINVLIRCNRRKIQWGSIILAQ